MLGGNHELSYKIYKTEGCRTLDLFQIFDATHSKDLSISYTARLSFVKAVNSRKVGMSQNADMYTVVTSDYLMELGIRHLDEWEFRMKMPKSLSIV